MSARGAPFPTHQVAAEEERTPRARERFQPESIKPTNVPHESPPPRRQRPRPARNEFAYPDMEPTRVSSGALTAAALHRAFGPSPLVCNPAPAAFDEEPSAEIAQEELERLKKLDISELLRHFSGEDVHTPKETLVAPSPNTGGVAVAGYRGTRHWPTL